MGSSKQPKETTTKTEPWAEQKPYLMGLFKEAQDLYGRGGPQYYNGTRTAGFNPSELGAQAALTGFGNKFAPAVAGRAKSSYNFLTDPSQQLDPSKSPYMSRAARAATRPLYDQLADTVLPNIRSGSLASGTYGSNRQAIAEGLATGKTARAAGDITSKMYSDFYEQGMGNIAKGLALGPTVQQMGTAGAEALGAVGQQKRSYAQALIDESVNRYNYGQNLPYQNLGAFQNFIQGSYGGQSTAQQPRQQVNPITGAIGGAATGAAIGSVFSPGVGTAAGAGVGALLSLFM